MPNFSLMHLVYEKVLSLFQCGKVNKVLKYTNNIVTFILKTQQNIQSEILGSTDIHRNVDINIERPKFPFKNFIPTDRFQKLALKARTRLQVLPFQKQALISSTVFLLTTILKTSEHDYFVFPFASSSGLALGHSRSQVTSNFLTLKSTKAPSVGPV